MSASRYFEPASHPTPAQRISTLLSRDQLQLENEELKIANDSLKDQVKQLKGQVEHLSAQVEEYKRLSQKRNFTATVEQRRNKISCRLDIHLDEE